MNVSRETLPAWKTWPPEKLLVRSAQKLGLDLAPDQVARLLAYWTELLRWNQKINLLGPVDSAESFVRRRGDPAAALVRHLADALAPLPFLPPGPLRVLDLGSGAGLPGLALKLARPAWRVTLAESRGKKAAFLRQAVRSLNLEGVQVLAARLEPGHPEVPSGAFDLVTARALGPLTRFLPLARPFLAPQGQALAYKGPRAEAELREAAPLLTDLGLSLTRLKRLRLPFLNHHRILIFFEVG